MQRERLSFTWKIRAASVETRINAPVLRHSLSSVAPAHCILRLLYGIEPKTLRASLNSASTAKTVWAEMEQSKYVTKTAGGLVFIGTVVVQSYRPWLGQ